MEGIDNEWYIYRNKVNEEKINIDDSYKIYSNSETQILRMEENFE